MSTMMNTTISLCGFMLPLMFDEWLFARKETKRTHFGLRCGLALGLYVLCGVSIVALIMKNVMSGQNYWMYLVVFLFSILVFRICYHVNIIEVTFITSCGYALQHMGFALYNILRYFFLKDEMNTLESTAYNLIVQIIVTALVYAFVIKRNEYVGERKEKDPKMVTLAVIVLFCTVFLSLWTENGVDSPDRSMQFVMLVVCRAYAVICCMLVIWMEYAVSRMNVIARQKEFMEQLVKAEGSQLQMSQESVSIINRKCHDIKYQMRALRMMDNSEKRQEYIEELQKAISIYDSVYHTGNEALNLLLREKTLLCDEYEIQFSCMADGKCLSFIETDDLYVLLGNALDNAIESVLKEVDKEKRVVSVNIGERQGMIRIHIENYCMEVVHFREGLPLTSKENKNMHGFGTQSIQFLVEKYQGSLVMQQIKDTFYLDVFFPLRK